MGAGFVIAVLLISLLLGMVAKHSVKQEIEEPDENQESSTP